MALGKLVVNLSANISEFGSAMDKAAHVADRNMTAISRSVGIAAVAIGALGVKAVAAFSQSAMAAIKFGDDLDKAATKAGIAVETMSELAYAAALADVDLNGLSESFKKLQINISKASSGSKEQVETFNALGLSVEKLARLAPEDQFLAVAEQISKIEEPGDRARAITEALGRSALILLPLFEDGAKGIRGMMDEAKKFGATITKEQNDKLVEMDDNIKRLSQSWGGFVRTVTSSASSVLSPILEAAAKAFSPASLTAQIKAAESALESLKGGYQGPGSDYERTSKRLEALRKLQAEEIRIAKETNKAVEEITKEKPKGFEDEEAKREREARAKAAAAAAKRIEEERQSILDSSLKTYMQLVLSAEEMALWELASKGANAEQLATLEAQLVAIREQTRLKEAQKETDEAAKKRDADRAALLASFPDLWYDAASAAEKYTLDLAKAEELGRKLVEAGLDWATAMEYVERVQKNVTKEYEKANSIAVEFGEAISSSFEAAILQGKGLQDVLKGILQDLLAIIIRAKVTTPLGNAITGMLNGGGGGDILSTIVSGVAGFLGITTGGTGGGAVATRGVTAPLPPTFSPPGRAFGGSVLAGNAYLVGENGPEIFMPKTPGEVLDGETTRGALGGRRVNVVNQTFNISTPNADSFRLSQRQLSRRAKMGLSI